MFANSKYKIKDNSLSGVFMKKEVCNFIGVYFAPIVTYYKWNKQIMGSELGSKKQHILIL